ncbi:MAG: hypothetical protein KF690_05700 [Bacteroidetes bacterium]|nr:hypothetical protein [Bacteroidota bacterium]
MKKNLLTLLLICGSMLPASLQAQFTGKAETFLPELKDQISRQGVAELNAWYTTFAAFYESSLLDEKDKKTVATTLPIILKVRGYSLAGQGVMFLRTLQMLKDSTATVEISHASYLKALRSSVEGLSTQQYAKLHTNLEAFLKTKTLFASKDFRWTTDVEKASFKVVEIYDEKLNDYRTMPRLELPQSNLTFKSEFTQATIQQTGGLFDPISWTWAGQGGRYDWDRAGLDTRDVFCELGKYDINLYQEQWKCDSVVFTYSTMVGKPLKGRLEEVYEHNKDRKTYQYPHFTSHDSWVEMPNIMPEIDYAGGFSLRGSHRYGTADGKRLAELTIKYQGDRRVRAGLKELDLDNPDINQPNARITIFLPGKDTLSHIDMKLRYNNGTKALDLVIDRDSPAHWQPILSSYHKMGFWFDRIVWNLTEDTLLFTSTIAQDYKKFAIESQDFFRLEFFRQYQGTLDFNPINVINRVYMEDLNGQIQARNKEFHKRQKARNEPEKTPEEEEDDYNPYEYGWDAPPPVVAVPETTATGEIKEPPLPEVRPRYVYTVDEVLKRFDKMDRKNAFKYQLGILAGAGFLYFDGKTEEITMLPKLVRWAAAAQKARDYDGLQLLSYAADGKNAYLSYKDKTLQLNGCETFYLSDTLLVSAFPEDYKVWVHENRKMNFGGGVKAGKLNLTGKGSHMFTYNWEDHKIFCDSIDFLRFVPSRDAELEAKQDPSRLLTALKKLRIEGITGAIYVSQPGNKSCIKPFAGYPVFDCYTESFVYWNDSTIQKGAYPKDQIRFILDPFVIDSLENFDNRALEFQGEFFSNGIFPEFRDTLMPVADNTYGVHEYTPENGLKLYKGKGQYYNEITMDNYGLWGNGKIDYLSSVAESDTFTFYPNMVTAKTRSFKLKGGAYNGIQYPEIEANNLKYTWHPQEDKLVIETAYKEPMRMYGGTSEFFGKLVITPKGVYADGALAMGNMQIESDSMDMREGKLTTDKGTLKISDPDMPTKYHFISANSVIEYNVESAKADFFNREPEKANISFPQIKYETTVGKGVYDKKANVITLVSNTERPKTNVFTSTDPGQKGLSFNGQASVYAVNEAALKITGADSIKVADAVLFPNSGKVTILPTGKVAPLDSARIVCNDTSRYHLIYDAKATIAHAKSFTGNGQYTYATIQGKQQVIFFDKISVQGDSLTIATGKVTEDQGFFVSEKMYFRNTATLTANRRFLGFDGEVKVEFDNPAFDSWIAFSDGYVNPDTVIVKIDADKLKGKYVGMSYYSSLRNRYLYQLFLEPKTASQRKDRDILLATGALTYDKATGKFRIGPPEKLLNHIYTGNVMETDERLEVKTARGYFGLPVADNPVTKTLKIRMAGQLTQFGDPVKMNGEMVLALDLPVNLREAFVKYGSRMTKDAIQEFPASFDSRLIQESISEIMDRGNPAEPLSKQLWEKDLPAVKDPAQLKVGKYLPADLVLSNVKFKYCSVANALYTAEDVSLLSVAGEPINRVNTARIIYAFGRPDARGNQRPDTLRLYVGWANDFEYLFIEATEGYVRMTSTHMGTRQVVEEQVGKMAKKNELGYTLVNATPEDVDIYRNRFSLRYSPTACEAATEDGEEAPEEEEQPEEEAPAEEKPGDTPPGNTPPKPE